MTTLCTIFGLIPMALGLGEGAETNASLAISVIGGLTVSTFLTLVFVPTLYMIVESWRIKRHEARV
jgi:HAE1 family hydrophobic/amphiphilic exporter-1